MAGVPLTAKINLIFQVIMVLVYMAMGTFILVINFNLLNAINPDIKKLLGILLIAYGLYRLYRLIKNYREKTDEDNPI